MEKLKRMRVPIKIWNKEVFGDTREIKRDIIGKIQWLDKKDEENTIEEFEVLERRSLRNRLEEVIFKEAVAWKQKMKLRWIKEWDNNSRLFHILVNNRRNKNAISRLEKENGSVLNDQKDIEREIIRFYEKLFMEIKTLIGPFKGYNGRLLHDKKRNDWREDLTWKRLKRWCLVVTEINLRGQMATQWLFIRTVGILLRRICSNFLRSFSEVEWLTWP